MKHIYFLVLLFLAHVCLAKQADSLTHIHLGTGCSQGSYQFENGIHVLSGVGADIWNNYDEFDFAYVKLKGDMQIVARVTSTEFIHNWTKAGVMIRETLHPFSKFAFTLYAPQNLIAFQNRTLDGVDCEDLRISSIQLPYWVKMIRKANVIVSQISTDGKNWNTIRALNIEMPDSIYYGLAVTSHTACTIAKAEFDSVSITEHAEALDPQILNDIVQSKTLYSTSVQDSFKVYINFPPNYDLMNTNGYPVVYYLDGNNLSYHYIIRGFTISNLIPEVISVSIGYPGSTQRTRDYTYGFSNFYAFMKNELIPYVDSKYNTNKSNRTLFGHSFGGLCGLLTLFQNVNHETFPFQNIISSSPSIWWPDGQYTYNCEQALYNSTKSLPVNFYMTMGSAEPDPMIPGFNRMSTTLISRNYQYFNFKNVLNEGQSHGSNSEVSFRNGILWILNQPLPTSLKLTQNTLEKTMVYPNPAYNNLTIDTKSQLLGIFKVELINLSGQTVVKTSSDKQIFNINTSSFPRGVYILKLTDEKKQLLQKVIFQ